MEQNQTLALSDVILAQCRQAAADLNANGWAGESAVLYSRSGVFLIKPFSVIPAIVNQAERDAIYKELDSTLKAVVQGAGKNGYRTELPINKGMILEPAAICHSKAAWMARKATVPYWAALYGTADLLCSFDRINIYERGARNTAEWLHTDQSGLLDGRYCIQGYLDINGTGPNDAGLHVAEKSHLDHRAMLEEWNVRSKGHWYLLRPEQATACRQKYQMLKVQCPPGSLVVISSCRFSCVLYSSLFKIALG